MENFLNYGAKRLSSISFWHFKSLFLTCLPLLKPLLKEFVLDQRVEVRNLGYQALSEAYVSTTYPEYYQIHTLYSG